MWLAYIADYSSRMRYTHYYLTALTARDTDCHGVCQCVTRLRPAKTAKRVNILFVVDPRRYPSYNTYYDESRLLHDATAEGLTMAASARTHPVQAVCPDIAMSQRVSTTVSV